MLSPSHRWNSWLMSNREMIFYFIYLYKQFCIFYRHKARRIERIRLKTFNVPPQRQLELRDLTALMDFVSRNSVNWTFLEHIKQAFCGFRSDVNKRCSPRKMVPREELNRYCCEWKIKNKWDTTISTIKM